MSFKILLTALVTGISAVIITMITKSEIEFELLSGLSLSLFFGLISIVSIMFLYNKKFNNIREKVEELGD